MTRIEAAGASLLFLPPYSPDFNPIGKAFSRLKAMLRKAGARTVTGLWDLIGRLVDIFQPNECADYFSSCGQDPEWHRCARVEVSKLSPGRITCNPVHPAGIRNKDRTLFGKRLAMNLQS